MQENIIVFEKNAEFKRFIAELFDFYSNPENLGTGENTRESIFSEYKIEGGSKARKTKLKKRRLCKRKTRKHRK